MKVISIQLSAFAKTLLMIFLVSAIIAYVMSAQARSSEPQLDLNKPGQKARTVDSGQTNNKLYQLRIYEIFNHNKQAFHERFRNHAARIMGKYSFRLIDMWETESGDKTEFVYLLEWPDEDTMKSQWAAFMADEEWAEIKRVTGEAHGKMVGSIEEKVMRYVDYSPNLVH